MSPPPTRFTRRRKVRFADVDPAGIAFYPRYFEMLNETVEDWLDGLGWGFGRLHLENRSAVPARRIEADFLAPSRLGDVLDVTLEVERVGRTSLALRVAFDCGGEARWTAKLVLVMVDVATGEPAPWPQELKARLDG
jgi:4-hydroxybenzoyl-CoA thioesterase